MDPASLPSVPAHPIQVWCPSRRHRVKLDPQRVWSRAACPICRTTIDPWRSQRLRAALSWALPWRGWTPATIVSWVALAGALLITGVVRILGDRHWLGTVVLFAGRWIWLVPVVLWLLILTIWRPRPLLRPLLPAALAGVVVLFLVMDLTLGWQRLLPAGAGQRVRVLTFNTAADALTGQRLALILQQWQPAIAAFQECGTALRDELGQLGPDWFVDTTEGCLASRFPIDSITRMPSDHLRVVEGAGIVVTYHLATDAGPIVFTSIHLETARHGLEQLLSHGLAGINAVRDNITLRDLESEQARRWVDRGGGPAIVAGDFNLPKESAVFDRHWGDLIDAWDRAGVGFGPTKNTGWIRLRIDHVLTDRAWRAVQATTGPSYGSDHWPVIVDLIRR